VDVAFGFVKKVPLHDDPHSLWNLDEGHAGVFVLGAEAGGEGDEEDDDKGRMGGAAEQLELLQQYVGERLESTKAERKLVSGLGSCGLSVQLPPQDPTLADFDIDNVYVVGIIKNAVRRFESSA
jgi:hypothetical protein